MRITDLMKSQLTLNDINNALQRMNTTELQLSSGLRINQPSDDPYGTSLAIALNGQMSGLNAYNRNVNDGLAWSQTADAALTNINNMTERVRELVVQGSNGTNSQQNLNGIAAEVNQLTSAITQEANTQYAGQYIFAGTNTTTAPYQQATGDVFQGNSGQIFRQIGPNSQLQINSDISQLLGSGQGAADGKLLDVLRTAAQDLTSGNVANLGNDLNGIDANINTLDQMQATQGANEDRLTLASSRIQDLQTNTTQALANTEDTDMAKASIDYSTEQAAFQAALRSSANIVQSSLLDFLH